MNGAPWGGSEEFWYHLATWMSKRGYVIECCFFDWASGKEKINRSLKESGCMLHLLPNPKTAGNFLQKKIIHVKIKKQLISILRNDYDLTCISQGGLLDVTFYPFNDLLPHLKKFVLVYHNYNDKQILSKNRRQRLYKWSQAAAQNMVAAHKIIAAVQKVAGFDLPHYHVLVNPITIPVQQEPYPWPSKSRQDNLVWITIGQLDVQRKAQDVLLRALAGEKWSQRNWELHIYGEGQDEQKLADLIIALQLQHKVFLEGRSDVIQDVLAGAHLLLHITHLDAMPLGVVEAMNMARPCIVSNVGDMPLWITDCEHGFVVENATEQMIDHTLERAWQQKESWAQMGINAFHKFREKYPVPYEEHYEKYVLTQIES
jgi:glycosyltransferase involved in cell wall biosynthesis